MPDTRPHQESVQIDTSAEIDAATGFTFYAVTDPDGTPGEAGVSSGALDDRFATAAQGALADSATQPGDLGTAAASDTGDFATAAQGTLAGSAIQPGDLGTAAASDVGDFDAAGDADAAVAAHAALDDGTAHSASGVGYSDPEENLVGLDVGAALTEIGILLPTFTSRFGGGGEGVATLADVSGATDLDLDGGNVQWIQSSTGTHTLTITNPSLVGSVAFVLVSEATHAPTWFSGINWINGVETIAWDGTREVFSFLSLDSGTTWIGWHLTPTAPIDSEPYSIAGELTVTTGSFRMYNDTGVDRTITSVRASVGTAPTGAAIIVDVRVDGTTIFTTPGNRPEIAVSTQSDLATTIENADWPDGSYITVDVSQIGSTVAGSNLTVSVNYREG